jgi:two-component system, sensor histidine kinase RpfC
MAHVLHTWWSAQKTRTNYGEFAQALLRIGIAVLLVLTWYPWVDWRPYPLARYLCLGFVALSFVLFALIYRAKQSSDVVRFLTLAIDMGAPTILLGLTGETSAILVFVYTWVAVGHGFRFGLRYLRVAWTVSLVLFVCVYVLSAAVKGFWYAHPLVWLGAFFWVAAPTLYVAQLLKQKLVAVQAAEESRVRAERAQADADRERVERARAEAERARAEAEAASEAKSEFLATMSHEMRTPLTGVVGAAEMLAASQLQNRERQLVDWLLASSRQLRSLIDNLLDLRKIEAGKIVLEQAPFDLHVLMNRVATLFEPEAKRAHLRFTKSISVDTPYMLVGDDIRIQQVLINLVANALKFTNRGFVRMSVCALESTDQSVVLRFEIRDTGIGITPDHAGRIFDRFAQANPTIHRQYGGSGLGTTICKHLVELMGGSIDFDSQSGQGTTFWFSVPLSRQPAEAYEDATVSVRDVHLLFSSGSALRNAWIAKVAQERGLQLSVFASASEALDAAQQRSRDNQCILVVDAEDPAAPRREVPALARTSGTTLPCVLMRSGVDEAEAFDAGYVSVISPHNARLLVRALRSVLARASPLQSFVNATEHEAREESGLNVLVAEDSQISQQILAMILQAGGHEVVVVNDGDSVIETFRGASFDVLILDMHMPGRSGLEVVRTIRQLETEEQCRPVPIIMLTAAANVDLRDRSIEAGVDLFLTKPVDPRTLLGSVQQVAGDRSKTSANAALIEEARPPYIDGVLLRDMAGLAPDSDFLETLARKFARDAGQLIDELETAKVRQDSDQFCVLVHALKGTAMMAGAVRLRDSAEVVERIGQANIGDISAELIGDLKATLAVTNDQLARFVA